MEPPGETVKCPNCGAGNVSVDVDTFEAKCLNCGKTFNVAEEVDEETKEMEDRLPDHLL